MKSELQKMLEKKASTIIEVSYLVDVECTLQERDYIFELIKKIDIDFYKIVTNNHMTFTYGDKYFYPANELFICIPKGSNFKGLKKFPVTTLLRSIGFETDKDILELLL